MENKYKLSVCIVAYHNYDDILEAIKTLEEFTSKNISKVIYIVDNSVNLSDKDIKKANKFKHSIQSFKDVYYLSTGRNLGFGAGHNFVIPNLNSEYHCIMNPDILFNEDAFKPILEYLDNNVDVGMVIPNITDENGNRQLVYREEVTLLDMFIRMFCKNHFKNRQRKHTLQFEDYTKPFEVPFGQGSFLIIRTELFKKLNGFDDKFFMYLEDADLCKRVSKVSKFMYLPQATVIHKWERASHKNLKLFKIHIQSMNYYFKKWGLKLF